MAKVIEPVFSKRFERHLANVQAKTDGLPRRRSVTVLRQLLRRPSSRNTDQKRGKTNMITKPKEKVSSTFRRDCWVGCTWWRAAAVWWRRRRSGGRREEWNRSRRRRWPPSPRKPLWFGWQRFAVVDAARAGDCCWSRSNLWTKRNKNEVWAFFLEFSGKKIPSSRKPRLNFEMNTENIKMKKKRSVRIPNFKSVLASGIVFTESCSQDKLLSESNFSPLESGSFIFEKKLNFLYREFSSQEKLKDLIKIEIFKWFFSPFTCVSFLLSKRES